MADIKDNFRPRRTASIDGFLSDLGQQPRRPAFRASGPQKMPLSPKNSNTNGADLLKATPEIGTKPKPQQFANSSKQIDINNTVRSDIEQKKSEPMLAVQDKPDDNYLPPERRTRRPQYEPPTKKPSRFKGRFRFKRFHKTKVFGIILLLMIGALGYKFYDDIARLTGNRNPLSVIGGLRAAPLKNTNGRVNILVAGNSADDLGHNGGELTDSIMVLSVDTKKNTALMLSVPRDMWVKIPGEGHAKINSAYTVDGMDTLKTVIEDNLEMPIHYTTLVNYTAFKDLVDAVGGITISIQSDDPRGIYDPNLDYTSRYCCALAKYPNGKVKLNGKQALNLARARGDGYGAYGFPRADFDRTENQRKMLLAIRERASSPSVIANPLKISSLVDAVGTNAKTDLNLGEMQTLYSHMKKIDVSKIDSYNVATLKGEQQPMLVGFTSSDGQSALQPAAGLDDYSEIAAAIRRVFTANPVTKEAAEIVILNATSTSGLARRHATKLDGKGMSVILQGNTTTRGTSVIIDNSGGTKPNTINELKRMYGATVITDPTLSANYPNTDIILVLGENVPKQDAKAANSAPQRD